MRVTLELPNNIQTLSPEKQKEKLLQELQNFQRIKAKIKQLSDKQSKWAKTTKRVEDDPVHLEWLFRTTKKRHEGF